MIKAPTFTRSLFSTEHSFEHGRRNMKRELGIARANERPNGASVRRRSDLNPHYAVALRFKKLGFEVVETFADIGYDPNSLFGKDCGDQRPIGFGTRQRDHLNAAAGGGVEPFVERGLDHRVSSRERER